MTSAEAPEAIYIPSATDDPAAYQQALLEVLGDQDHFSVIATTPSKVRALCADLPLELAGKEAEPGEWSVEQIVGHLYDVDIVYGFRWRLVLTEDSAFYPGYDEKRWALLPRLPFWQTLNAWEGLRASNAALLRALTDEDHRRTGLHGEQGAETIDVMVRKVAGHDLAHLNQIERTVWALRH
jgi:hypothetical protein